MARTSTAVILAMLGDLTLHSGDRVWPLLPIVQLPYVSVAGVPYPPGSTSLKQALATSRGDAESGNVAVYVEDRDEASDELYKGTRISRRTRFIWDLRENVAVYRSIVEITPPGGEPKTETYSTPFAPTPAELEYRCVLVPGQWTNRQSIHTRCAVLHQVTKSAKAGPEHGWYPVKVGIGFRKEPLPTNCTPVTEKPKWIDSRLSLVRGGLVHLNLATQGFKNEQAHPDGGWSLGFDLSPTNDR